MKKILGTTNFYGRTLEKKVSCFGKKTGAIWSPVLLQAVFYNSISSGTLSGWRYGVIIGPFFMASFVKQQNNWRDGVKVVHEVMAW